jgi:hypothetical protein
MESYKTLCKGIPATQYFLCPTILVPQSERYKNMLRVVKEGLEVTRWETQDFYNQKYSKYEKREINLQIIYKDQKIQGSHNSVEEEWELKVTCHVEW